MMHTGRLASAILLLSLLAGCATAPEKTNSYPVDLSSDCASRAAVPALGGGDTGLILFTLMLGIDTVVYTGCEIADLFQPVPDSVVAHGFYHSGDGNFFVALPPPPADGKKPIIEIAERQSSSEDYVALHFEEGHRPVLSGVVAYGIDVALKLDEPYRSMSPEQFATHVFSGDSPFTDKRAIAAPHPLYREQMTLDGKPTIFWATPNPVISSLDTGSGSHPVYVLAYVIKKGPRAALLVILWHGDCPRCSTGSEQDIRQMDPGIARFVESFRLNDSGDEGP